MKETSHLKPDGTPNIRKPFPIAAAAESLARRALEDLDVRQAIFVTKYVETFDRVAAGAAAGYEEGYVKQLIHTPLVARAIQLLQTDKLHKMEANMPVNAEMVIHGIVRNIHALEAKGKNESTFKGYELLGKHLSMWTEKIDMSVDTTKDLSPEEKASRVAALVALAQARKAREENTIDAEPISPAPQPTDNGEDLL